MHCLLAMGVVVPVNSLSSFSTLSYIFIPAFLGVLMLVWFLLCFLHSFKSLYKNLISSLFLLNSRGGSYASACSDSTDEFLNAPVYILRSSLCMWLSFFSLPGEAVLHS